MALAQDAHLMLLDEPTTYLDIAHQVEILELLKKLNIEEARTVVMVLHDINQGSRYADHVVAISTPTMAAISTFLQLVTQSHSPRTQSYLDLWSHQSAPVSCQRLIQTAIPTAA